MTETGTDPLEHTQVIFNRIYSESGIQPTPIDLHTACAIGIFDIVNDSVDAKRNLDTRNKAGWTPLMYAAYVGNDIIVNLLLEGGANPNLGTKEGTTPLMVAAGCGNANACYLLLQYSANINAQNSQGHTALMSAIRQGHQVVVQLLLEAGADVELQETKTKRTGLMLAAIEGDEIIVDILIACGAHVKNEDHEGHTARSLALYSNHMRTVTLLDSALDSLAADAAHNVSMETGGDLFSGVEEMTAYQKSIELKKAIESDLFLAVRECHVSGYRRKSEIPSKARLSLLRSAKSMPERDAPPHFDEEEEERVVSDPNSTLRTGEESEENPLVVIANLLDGLDLLKYLPMFEQLPAMGMAEMLNLTEEDLKTMGITLWGPRRKIFNAIAKLKQDRGHEAANPAIVNASPGLKKQFSTELDGEEDGRVSTPQVNNQAYQEAIATINNLNAKISQEYHLRKVAEGHLMEVQRYRQRCQGIASSLEMNHKDSIHHASALRASHYMVCQQLDVLKHQVTAATKDPAKLQRLFSDVATLASKMKLEFEALSRAQSQTSEDIRTLDCHLKSP